MFFVLLLILSVAIFYLAKLGEQRELTEDEVKIRVEKVYTGEIMNIVQKDDGYIVAFSKDKGIYEVFINKTNGKFSELKIVHENKTVGMDHTSNEQNNEQEKNVNTQQSEQTNNTKANNKQSSNSTASKEKQTSKQTRVLLTEKQVQQIALKQFPGEIDNIEYVNRSDGGYYLVEVENDEEEAEFQIHAVTGKILSVKFDD